MRAAVPPKKCFLKHEPIRYTCEDLLRQLVIQASASSHCSAPIGEEPRGRVNEEIILDVDLDGSHYLLIRLPKEDRPHVHLSPREQEIVRMVAKGHSNKIIADVLNISSWTVCTHLRRIFAKLGVSTRAAMVAKTLEETRPWDQTSGEGVTTKAIVTSGASQPGAHAGSGKKGVAVFSRSFSRRVSP